MQHNPPRRRGRKTIIPLVAAGMLLATACGTGESASGGDAKNAIRRPVDLIVPFGPGGGADQVARALGTSMASTLGVDVPVVNVAGATGSTGMTKMGSAQPGSSMSILIQDTLATVPAGTASFKREDVRGICRVQSMPSALLVRSGTHPNWDALASAAKAGELKVGTVGRASVDDIALAALAERHGTKFRAVPFANPSERYSALLGGAVDVLYEQLGDVRQYLDSHEFQPVLLFAEEKVAGYESIPLATEIGLSKEDAPSQFRGVVVDAKTPDNIVQALSGACESASRDPRFGEFQQKVFAYPDSFQSASAFDSFLDEQTQTITAQLKKYALIR